MRFKKIINVIFEYEQKVFILLFAVFFIGFIFGCYNLFISNGSLVDLSFTQNGATKLFLDCLLKNSLLLGLIFVLGYTAFAAPILFLVLLYSGVFNGVLISMYLNGTNLLKCVAVPLIVFPYFIMVILAQFYVSFSSLKLSTALLNVFKKGTRYISPKKYIFPHITKFCFFIFITTLATLLYSFIIQPIFLKIL